MKKISKAIRCPTKKVVPKYYPGVETSVIDLQPIRSNSQKSMNNCIDRFFKKLYSLVYTIMKKYDMKTMIQNVLASCKGLKSPKGTEV